MTLPKFRTNAQTLDLSLEVMGRLHAYAVALCAREATIETVAEDWPEFFDLAQAFVTTHGSDELHSTCTQAGILAAIRQGVMPRLTMPQRRCLMLIAREMRQYLMRVR